MKDPVSRHRAELQVRVVNAERSVATLRAALNAGCVAEGRREQLGSLLAQREAELAEARRDLEAIKNRPRWLLERELKGAT
jgi:hypothetical protein